MHLQPQVTARLGLVMKLSKRLSVVSYSQPQITYPYLRGRY